MALVFIASMVAGIVMKGDPTYSNGWANWREFTGGCALADDVLVEPDSNAGFMPPLPGNYGPLGPLGGVKPNRVHPLRCTGTYPGRGGPGDDGAAARHRLRLGRADQADGTGHQRINGAAAVRP